MCTKHPSNKAEIYCTTCEMPICHICATLKHKSPDHDCIETTEAAACRKGVVMQRLLNLERDGERAIAKINERTGIVKRHASNLKESIGVSCMKIVNDKKTLIAEIDRLLESDLRSLNQCQTTTEDRLHPIQDLRDEVIVTLDEASDGDFLLLYDTLTTTMDKVHLTIPGSVECQTQVDSQKWIEAPRQVLGRLSTSSDTSSDSSNIKLCPSKQYKPQDKSRHEFYGIDSLADMIAVTDREANQVVLLDSASLRILRVVDGQDSKKIVAPIDVGLYAGGNYMIVIDQCNHGTVYTNQTILTESAYETAQYDIQLNGNILSEGKTLSVVADNKDRVIIGVTSGEGYRWLIRCGQKGASTKDAVRIAQIPNFLTMATDGKHMLISDTLAGTVSSLGRDGTKAFQLDRSAGQHSPRGLCCDNDGNVYVASVTKWADNTTSSSIHKYTSVGCYVACLGDFDHVINGITFTKAGKLVAACGDSVKLMDLIEI